MYCTLLVYSIYGMIKWRPYFYLVGVRIIPHIFLLWNILIDKLKRDITYLYLNKIFTFSCVTNGKYFSYTPVTLLILRWWIDKNKKHFFLPLILKLLIYVMYMNINYFILYCIYYVWFCVGKIAYFLSVCVELTVLFNFFPPAPFFS